MPLNIQDNANSSSLGATGHIGGAVLDLISSTFPELQVKVLVRDQQKSDQLTAHYPNVTPVIGGLENVDILEAESRAADTVISKVCEHLSIHTS